MIPMAYMTSPAPSTTARALLKRLRIGLVVLGAVLPGMRATAQVKQTEHEIKRDPRALLQKVMQSYNQLSSYDGEANVDTLLVDAKTNRVIRQVGSSSHMIYQKPNKLWLSFTTPAGSRTVWSDGITLWVYDGSPHQYTKGPSAPTLPLLLPLLLARADVAAGMDPLFFLSQSALPSELTDLQYKGTTNFEGVQVFVVTGVTNKTPRTIHTANGQTVNIPTSYWTWWIDKRSYLLHKVELATPHVTKQLTFGSGLQTVVKQFTGTLILRHTVSSMKPNTPVDSHIFVFKAPKDAIEKKTVSDILKSSK